MIAKFMVGCIALYLLIGVAVILIDIGKRYGLITLGDVIMSIIFSFIWPAIIIEHVTSIVLWRKKP